VGLGQRWQNSKADKASIAYDRGLEAMQANNPVGADAAFTQAAEGGQRGLQGPGPAATRQYRPRTRQPRSPTAVMFDEAAKASGDPLF
jgi:hypothetical protein